jgi:Protein tyrosine and serine/threonine kinase
MGDNESTALAAEIHSAADNATMYINCSQRLRDRVIKLVTFANASTTLACSSRLEQLLVDIKAQLQSFERQLPTQSFDNHAAKVQQFDSLNRQLFRLAEKLRSSIIPIAQRKVEDAKDQRKDFDHLLDINKRLLSESTVNDVNKALLLSAPLQLVGFKEINYDDLRLQGQLGVGSFGRVNLCIRDGQPTAVMRSAFNDLDVQVLQAMRNELRIHALPQLKHERIVEFYAGCTVAPHFALVMEYAPLGSINDLLYKSERKRDLRKVRPQDRVQMIEDIAAATNHLHKHGVVHADIKSANAVLFEHYRVKLCDFGLAEFKSSLAATTTGGTRGAGTPGWMSPEGVRSFKSDVYSFSMVMYEIITGQLPLPHSADPTFDRDEQLLQHNIIGECTALVDLMKWCWRQDPEKRPAFRQIVQVLDCKALTIQATADSGKHTVNFIE